MNGHLALAIAISMEVIATSALASIQGFSKPLPLLAVIVSSVPKAKLRGYSIIAGLKLRIKRY